MATAVKTPKTKTSTRITSETIRTNAKRDLSPKWDNVELMSAAEFASYFRFAMKYYNMESSGKELKPQVINWMGHNGYSKSLIQSFKKTKDWRCNTTMGAIAACLIKGMPEVRADFNNGRSTAEWLRNEINKVIEDGRHDIEEVAVDKKEVKATAPVLSIQDRIREQAVQMSEELDAAIDSWISDAETFDPKAFKVINLLKGKGVKAAQARFIKGFFEKNHNELLELASGTADAQLKEAYSHNSRKNVKKLIEFYESIKAACEQISAEAKVLKKPRAKKIKPAEDLVKKLKFMLSDTKLGITSVPPVSIIGSQGVVIYNTKTRKIGYYIAKSSAGLTVKNSSIADFTEKSMQKTLRKPIEQIKEFKEQSTQKRFESWFTKSVKTTETVLNGRVNEDIIILKVYK